MKKVYSKIKVMTSICLLFVTYTMASQNTVKPIVRLQLNTTSFNDETVFYFEQGGTTSFQSSFDAYKLLSGNHPYIGSMSDSILTSISGLPALPVNLNIRVKAITPSTGSFTFSSLTEDFPEGICVTLYDAFTGLSTNILSSTYVCTLYDTTSMARFTMNFFTTDLTVSSFVKRAECQSANGMIVVNSVGMCNFEWKNSSGILKTSLNKMVGDTLSNLNGGIYTVNVSDAGGCGNFSTSFVMEQVITPTASFSSDLSTNVISNNQVVNFTNSSTNAHYSSWDFGDKSGIWYLTNPSHNYLTPGTYTVTLITESIHHCKNQAQKVITVVDGVTGISELSQNTEIKLFTLGQGLYSINLTNDVSENYLITLSDLNGNVIKTSKLEQVKDVSESFDLSSLSSGMYLLKVSNDNNSAKTFKVIK
ncbi:T9SS type A sorting domain-containing protein [Aurantibacillus circumpalustris]|uniref:T9SS type A sorting domain-containing protein n=1 Tax=Aurantibacillus circumpalustris TaxID=3036359 RepID=UPI00295BB15D|nr:T9SS type A sorting domain-containing protein [Aurantibacillus circumpalustris]